MIARFGIQASVLVLLAAAIAAGLARQDAPVSAGHRPLYLNRYFVHEFIENPVLGVRVADCAGGHTHPSIIQGAVGRWNNTGKVSFTYVANDTVPCDAAGMPTVNGVISIFHNSGIKTGDYLPIKTNDANIELFRDNDWGPESAGLGMYRMMRARIQLGDGTAPQSTDYHIVHGLAHELGHAAGLADLYIPNNPGCTDDSHGSTTVMACLRDLDPIPGFDQTNLVNLYQRIPQAIPTNGNPPGPPNWHASSVTNTSITLRWTDYSFNEKDQIITRGFDNATNIVSRDLESFTWSGLSPGVAYCFSIKQRNAFGGTAASSPSVCATTTSPPPANPSNVRVCSVPCDLYGFRDNATNETGFGVIVQKRTTCASGTWTQVGSNILLPAKNQTDDVYIHNFVGPGCFRVRVQALGANGNHSSVISSTGVYFPN